MSGTLFALLERVHGHLALLGLAVLMHPVITLRTRRGLSWRMQLSADLGAVLLLVPFALGAWIYPTYRRDVKPSLWVEHHDAALLFETKEHLAAMAVALAVGGALALRSGGKQPAARQVAWTLLLLGWLCGAGAGFIGLQVAAAAHPGF